MESSPFSMSLLHLRCKNQDTSLTAAGPACWRKWVSPLRPEVCMTPAVTAVLWGQLDGQAVEVFLLVAAKKPKDSIFSPFFFFLLPCGTGV
jgi:hypothetical protein